MYTENDERREELERLLRDDARPYWRHLNRESVMLAIIRYLQTVAPESSAKLADQVLGILPPE